MRIISYKNTKRLAMILLMAILLSSDWCARDVVGFLSPANQNTEDSILIREISPKDSLVYEQSVPVETYRGMVGQIVTVSERQVERHRNRHTDLFFDAALFQVAVAYDFDLSVGTGESLDLLEFQILKYIHDSDGEKGVI